MSDSTTPTALSPYAYLAEGYLIFLRALRHHVKQRLADGESGDGWWNGPVRDRLERHTVGSYTDKNGQQQSRNRWTQIADLRNRRGADKRRPPEDFLDPQDLLLLVREYQAQLSLESDYHKKYLPALIQDVVEWRNQFFAHPGSKSPSAAEVVGFLHPARMLLENFNLPEEAQLKAISDAVKALGGASDSLEDDHERAVGAVIAGLKLYGDGGSVRLSIARSYANYFLGDSGDAPIPQDDADLLSLIEKDERVKAERSDEGTVWVRLSDSATSTEPQPLPPRRASTSTPPVHDDASPMAEEWIPRGIEAILEVRLRNGWAPISWCKHVLTSRYGVFPGAEADTGAVGAFFGRHPDHFEVVGRFTSGRVRLQQRSRASVSGDHIGEDEAVKATDIRDAIGKHAGSDGWAAVIDLVGDLTDVPDGFRLSVWLHAHPDLFEREIRDGSLYTRVAGQAEEGDGAQPRTTETDEANTDDVSDRPSKDTATSTPTAAQPQAAAGGSVGQTVHQAEDSAQAPYPEWADIVARTIEERSDRSDGWAKLKVVLFHSKELDPSAYGFTTFRDLLASRQDLFEVRDGRTGDSVGPDLVRIRERTESIDADYGGSVGQKAGPTQERDPDWPDWADLIAQAMEASGLRDGWANLGDVGNHVKRLQPEFEPREHGSSRLRDLVESRSDLFEIQDRRPQGIAAAALWIRIRGGRAGTE